MSWNYRVMRYPHGGFGIHEVFYADEAQERVKLYSTDPLGVVGDDAEELAQTLDWMRAALDKPVLDYEPQEEPDHDAAPAGESTEGPAGDRREEG